MKRRYYHLISIILVVAVIAALYFFYTYGDHPASTPIILYTSIISSENSASINDVLNASQGTNQEVNLTLSSITSAKIEIPIENLKLTAYNSTIDYGNNWDTNNWNTSLVQESVFNYSFSLSQLTLQPNMSNTTVVTIKWADSAPIGRYVLELNLGNLKFLSGHGMYDQSYGDSIWLGIILTPNLLK